jgi:hypothetical protein
MTVGPRLAAMSWGEFRTRAAQEAGKRLDLARYRLGLAPGASSARFRGDARGRFFFAPEELDARTRIVRERLPSVADEVVREAGEVCRHRFRLLGYSGLDYGPEIDWHLDAVSGKRSPLDPWFRIPFLDFNLVGDHKVIWELNRHQHLITLARAWRFTGSSRYVDEIVAQWRSWQDANPYPLGINWASSLEVAFRSLSWLWVRELLADCDSIPQGLRTSWVRALALNGRHIERYLSTYFSPNTHLIGEASALFFIGTLCPQLPAARRWQQRGWDILLAETARQVRIDGVYFEQSLYYHVYALDFFLHARQLAAGNGIEIPAGFDQALRRMLEVLQELCWAGVPEGFGDDDGGRVFNPRRNRAEHMRDPLALGAGIFGGFSAAELTEEAVWLLGLEEISTAPCPPPPFASKAFSSGGIYVMAAANPVPECLTIDGGPQGTGRSGHGHADALSVRLTSGGRRVLIDSGTFSYRDGAERDRFRGTSAHNTLRVDGQDQAVADGPFAWTAIPNVTVERWLQGVTFTLLAGSHSGYGRLEDPVRHRRFVLHVTGGDGGRRGFWLVRDVAEGKGLHQLEILWHLAPDLMATKEGDGFLIQPRGPRTAGLDTMRLHLLPASTSNWTHDLAFAEVSPAYGVKEQAPFVWSSASVNLPTECATLLALDAGSGHGCKFERLAADAHAEQRGVSAYCYTDPGHSDYFFFADTDDEWSVGPWSSNTKILYGRVEDRRLAHLVLCRGSFVSLHGKPVASCTRPVERFEYVRQGGRSETFSSDPSASPTIAEEAMELG